VKGVHLLAPVGREGDVDGRSGPVRRGDGEVGRLFEAELDLGLAERGDLAEASGSSARV